MYIENDVTTIWAYKLVCFKQAFYRSMYKTTCFVRTNSSIGDGHSSSLWCWDVSRDIRLPFGI